MSDVVKELLKMLNAKHQTPPKKGDAVEESIKKIEAMLKEKR